METPLADLVGPDGQASEWARSMAGRTITVRGYLAPSLDGIAFALSEVSPGACQLCGNIHDGGATITVQSQMAGSLPAFELVRARGRLVMAEGAAGVGLADAVVQAL